MVPMGAVRMTGRGKYIRPNAQRYLTYKKLIQMHVLSQVKRRELLTGPLAVTVCFTMPIPQSWSKKKKLAVVGEWHCKKPDIDNLVKGLFDSMNGLVWTDDNQVAVVKSFKIYGEDPKIEVHVEECDIKESYTNIKVPRLNDLSQMPKNF